MVTCWDCHILRVSGYFDACWRHATAEQKVAAHQRIQELANQPHPMLKMLERKR